jgi:lipase chaperone LimK
MMTRPADATKAASTLAWFGLATCTAAAAVWYFSAPARAPLTLAQGGAAVAAAPRARAARLEPDRATGTLPASLAGSVPPRLPLDEHGHLRKARAVRDFFDYFLTAQHQVPPNALDALVRKGIAAQLDGAIAEPEALEVWQRYRLYLQTLGSLETLSAQASNSGTTHTADLDAMQASLDERASVATRTLGADWSEAFFGPDWRHAHYMIERWRIQRDSTLTDAQKAARVQALEQSLPPDERASLERNERAQAQIRAIAQLQQPGVTIDQLRAKATQAFGPEAADRIVKMRQDDDAWHAKYAGYAAQRASIEAMGLSPEERDAQIAQLRRRVFTDPAQALRAASLDHGAER